MSRSDAAAETVPVLGTGRLTTATSPTILLGRVLGNAALLLGVFLTAMPFIYMITASLKPGGELYSIPFSILPKSLYLGNYELLFGQTSFVRWFANSVFVSLARTVLAIFLALMAGYAFAKFDFRFKNVLFLIVLGTLTLPIYVLIVPLYEMMISLDWIDSYWSLIIPFGAQAIGVFLARQHFLSIPNELLEAAHILPDGHPQGEPVIPNGLALCKLHHAAFDAYIIGVTPDLEVKVRLDVLEEIDGPMLQHGLQGFQDRRIHVPRADYHKPNRDFLAERFELFRKAS